METYPSYQENRTECLRDIELSLKRDLLPIELFVGAENEDEMLMRYAKYLVIKDLNASLTDKAAIKVASGSYKESAFVSGVHKRDPSITKAELEITAMQNGVFDYIWPLET